MLREWVVMFCVDVGCGAVILSLSNYLYMCANNTDCKQSNVSGAYFFISA